MRKLVYILFALVLLVLLTAINVFASDNDFVKDADKAFVKVYAEENGDDYFDIEAQALSGEEMKNVVGNINEHNGGIGSVGEVYDKWVSKNVKVNFGFKDGKWICKNILINTIEYYTTEDEYFIYHHYIIVRVILGKYKTVHRIVREKKYNKHVGLHG